MQLAVVGKDGDVELRHTQVAASAAAGLVMNLYRTGKVQLYDSAFQFGMPPRAAEQRSNVNGRRYTRHKAKKM
jgi:hypothetical protein